MVRFSISAIALSACACAMFGSDSLGQTPPSTGQTAPTASSAVVDLISNARQLTFDGLRAGEGYFSADGSMMIFQSERETDNPFYQMYLMDLETGDVRRVSPGHGKTTCGWIHPEKNRVLFASTQDDPAARKKMADEIAFRKSGQTRRYSWDYDPTYDIQEFDLKTNRYRNLTRTPGYDAEGAYSPDGSRIVFASNRSAYGRRLTTKEKEQLELDPSYFMDVYVMNADGSGVRRLTDTPGYDGGTFWSPDGSKIIWRRFSEDGARAEVFTMNADGSDQRKITQIGAMSWAPIFHPSGDYIIFSTNKLGFSNFELYLVDTDGRREPVRVTTREGFDGLPMFHPDGKRLSWTSNATGNATSQIFVADWNDKEARRLLGMNEKGDLIAQGPPAPALPVTVPGVSEADLKRHVEALASPAMEGRLTGAPGGDLAARYVASAFSALGLEPAGDNGTYLQSFGFTAGVSLGPDNSLTVTAGGSRVDGRADADWRPLSFSRLGKADRAGVVFAGYGIAAPKDGENEEYDSYAHLDVSGKWVLVWRGAPNAVDSKTRIHLSRFSELRYKAATARAKGAAGVIFAPAPGITYEDELPKLSYESGSGSAALPVIAVSRALADRMLAGSTGDMKKLIETLDAGAMVNGIVLSGVEAEANIALSYERRNGQNVLARLDLNGPSEAPVLVIGAHLDHLGRGEASGSLARGDERGQIHYGADDNASGVAALLEIAEFFASERAAGRLKGVRDVVFAAWEGEELGLLGSSYFIEAARKTSGVEALGNQFSAYLNMDMIGRLKDALILQGVGSSSVWKREIEQRNAVVGLPITTIMDSYLPTDATSFYLAGVPILSAFTGSHEEYHSPRDTPDLINTKGHYDITRLMALIARSQVQATAAPDYIKVDNTASQGRVGNVFLGTIPDYASEGIRGLKLSGVVQNGPAAKAGVQGGDIIVELGGASLENIYDYMQAMNGLKVGEETSIVVLRNGARLALRMTPSVRE
ncbi:MAG: M28 family peptidase [Alphaproteobacteria bacterium]|nr:M28 family peptidase [Alphaproteobacteria bacterium]